MTSINDGIFSNSTLLDLVYQYVNEYSIILLQLLGYASENVIEKSHTNCLIRYYEDLSQWFAFDEFQLKLLKGFGLILSANIIFICISWKVYGKRISERFMRPPTTKAIEELKKSVSQLKLPKEHSPRVSMSVIKKFFQKSKADAKFKMAGPGHRLNEPSAQKPRASTSSYTPSRHVPSAEAQQAGAAALAPRRELEAEKLNENKAAASPSKKDHSAPTPLTVEGVYFKCPLVGPDVLPKEKWNEKITEFLYEQLEIGSEDDKGYTAALIIQSCNRALGRERILACVEILCKYIENIVAHPEEEKYRKIRCSNRVYRDRVLPVQGADLLLQAAGFQACKMQAETQGNEEMEDFLVFDKHSKEDLDKLTVLIDALKTSEPIHLELDRNVQVLLSSQAAKPVNLPADFFSIPPEELKREMELRANAVEQLSMLRTKAMREREEQRERRLYKYTLIRIRFPDGIQLQGTFSVYERASSLLEFVQENLFEEDRSFMLISPTGDKLFSHLQGVHFSERKYSQDDNKSEDSKEEEDKTLMDLHLVPNAVLNFVWETGGMPAVSREKDEEKMFLKPDIMMLVRTV
ncbi:hypothetical protein J437_LFUL012947 [Ladona fulva]|uniref:UBX domain-containing protein n=1 Tax=Ladona fulva TaxID=123851 RepID=A0A8K0KEI1_LADFU|nr:hypothetical protein J437_LFUL012947 [Ladona fulva]